MQGKIGCDSTPGEGTTFWIDLNAPSSDQVVHPLALEIHNQELRGEKQPASRPIILHIDANIASIRLVEHLVSQRAGYKFLSCLLPEAGLTLAAREQPDIIFFDFNFPGIDGHEFLNKLKQQDSTKATPVIALSSGTIPQAYKNNLATDFSDYLAKPIDSDKFYNVIDKLIGKKIIAAK